MLSLPAINDGVSRANILMKMDRKKLNAYLKAAQLRNPKYESGYRRGISRYCEMTNEPDDLHLKWLSLEGEEGAGYRDGITGAPPKGAHGNIGNKNAQGERPADTYISARINESLKEKYMEQARHEQMSLSKWMIKALEVGYETSLRASHQGKDLFLPYTLTPTPVRFLSNDELNKIIDTSMALTANLNMAAVARTVANTVQDVITERIAAQEPEYYEYKQVVYHKYSSKLTAEIKENGTPLYAYSVRKEKK